MIQAVSVEQEATYWVQPPETKPWAAQGSGYVASPAGRFPFQFQKHSRLGRLTPHIVVRMANRGYDVVVDVDQEVRHATTLCATTS